MNSTNLLSLNRILRDENNDQVTRGRVKSYLCPYVGVKSTKSILQSFILHRRTVTISRYAKQVVCASPQAPSAARSETASLGKIDFVDFTLPTSVPESEVSLGSVDSNVKTRKYKFIPMEYRLDSFQRSNQDTCITHKPAVFEGDWIQSGDILTDCASSVGGELSLGQNLLIAYLPWEGYNFEDAILISERLVIDDLYTSVHIERYEMEIHQTNLGAEEITRDIPDVSEAEVEKLDSFGIVKVGSWVEEGDILVGKITPIQKNTISPYQKLLYTILEKKVRPFRDSSLRAPKGVKAKVIDIKYFPPHTALEGPKPDATKGLKAKYNELSMTELDSSVKTSRKKPNVSSSVGNTKLKSGKSVSPKVTALGKKLKTDLSSNVIGVGKWMNFKNQQSLVVSLNNYFSYGKKMSENTGTETENPLVFRKNSIKKTQNPFFRTLKTKKIKNVLFFSDFTAGTLSTGKASDKTKALKVSGSKKQTPLSKNFNRIFMSKKNTSTKKTTSYNKKLQTLTKVETIHIYLAETRKIQVGDKMSGRHGNKGIVSQILPIQDMPYLPDGTPIDMVLNPLGVPSRMNVGQIYECLLGLAGRYLGENYKVSCFDESYGPDASRSFVFNKLYEASTTTGLKWLFDPNTPGKVRIYDGRTGDSFDQAVTVGHAYILRLVHMVDDKIHMRSTGPYSLVTQQPLRGRSKEGGQRLGEMEVWALEGYGAAFTLLEMLTIKSDDMTGRMTLWSNLILNKDISIGTPESFKVLICELQALCLDIGLFRYTMPGEGTKKPQLTEIDSLINLP